MGRIAVPPELAGAGTQIHNQSVTFGELLAGLRTKVAGLEFTWTKSGAHDKYVMYTNEWDLASQALFTSPKGEGLLDQIADVMRIVANNYDTVEQTNASGWQFQ
jgi:hypothetical protein